MFFAVDHEIWRAAALGETCFKQAAIWIKTERALKCLTSVGIPLEDAKRLQKSLDWETMYEMHRLWGPHAISKLMTCRGKLTRYAEDLLATMYPDYEGERGLILPGCYFGFFFLLILLFQATVMSKDGDQNCTDFTDLITDLLAGAWPSDITEIPHIMHKRYTSVDLTACGQSGQLRAE